MNIGIVTTWFERGAAYVSRAYRDTLVNGGHSVFIFARGGEKYAENDAEWDDSNVLWSTRYNPISILSKHNINFINPLQIEKWLYDNKIDIVILNEEHGVECVSKVSKLGYIVGAYIDYYRKDTVDQFNVYDFLLCNTQRHYSVFKNHSNALFLQWGADITLYCPTRHNEHDNDGKTIVFFHSAGMGGTNNRKGTDLAIKAFQNVKGNAKLVIHSQVGMQKYGDDIRELIRKDDRIEFIEKTVKAPGLYYLGDVFVYPSRLEGIGLCVPEALASGLPVITTDTPPMSEFVENNYNGMLVEVETTQVRFDNYYWPESLVKIKSLTEKMQFYVDNLDILSIHKKNARESAEKKYNWRENSLGLDEFFRQFRDKRREIKRYPFHEMVENYLLVINIRAQTLVKSYIRSILK